MVELDLAEDQDAVREERERLIEEAQGLGLRMITCNVSEGYIPDPDLEALPEADLKRISAIREDMHAHPERHVDELQRLVAKHPHIPMLHNQLACALGAAGESGRAREIFEQTAERFPKYVFAFSSHVMNLIRQGRIDEARELVEGGPRGPVLTLNAFDPDRDAFHVSEATAYAAMVGHYMLAIGERELAELQLDLLLETDPYSPECIRLEEALYPEDEMSELAQEVLRKAFDRLSRLQASPGKQPGSKRGSKASARGKRKPGNKRR